MKRLITIGCFLLIPFVPACKREGEAAAQSSDASDALSTVGSRSADAKDKVSARLEAAMAYFNKKDIRAALVELEAAHEMDPKNPKILNLRGSCHVEMRDFEEAIDDFTAAAKELPQNAAIRFNLGEVKFVTKRWNESIAAFEEAKKLAGNESDFLRDLIDFKVMLCEAGLEKDEAFDRMASVNVTRQASPLSGYTRAAMEFHAGNENRGTAALATVAAKFPDAHIRAPWEDTLIVFGYINPEK